MARPASLNDRWSAGIHSPVATYWASPRADRTLSVMQASLKCQAHHNGDLLGSQTNPLAGRCGSTMPLGEPGSRHRVDPCARHRGAPGCAGSPAFGAILRALRADIERICALVEAPRAGVEAPGA
jgi:hypothetical protein